MCGEENNLYMNLSSHIVDSSLDKVNLTGIANSAPSKIQAFILPNLEDVNVKNVSGKVTPVGAVDIDTIKQLESFEVFIL